jgi:putative hydrolase of the HAD superfamily
LSNTIRNVIFDFGGVLFEIDYDLPAQAFQQLGFPGFRDLYTQAAQNPIFDLLETGKVSNEEFMAFLHEFVPNATREQVAHAWNVILLHIMPEEVAVVKRAKDAGFRTFLLSNTNAIHVEAFEQMIADRMDESVFKAAFEVIYYSNVLGMKKPHPETFLHVCALNNLKPEETLFIDDSLQHVQGAVEAGLQGYYLKPGERISQVIHQLIVL